MTAATMIAATGSTPATVTAVVQPRGHGVRPGRAPYDPGGQVGDERTRRQGLEAGTAADRC